MNTESAINMQIYTNKCIIWINSTILIPICDNSSFVFGQLKMFIKYDLSGKDLIIIRQHSRDAFETFWFRRDHCSHRRLPLKNIRCCEIGTVGTESFCRLLAKVESFRCFPSRPLHHYRLSRHTLRPVWYCGSSNRLLISSSFPSHLPQENILEFTFSLSFIPTGT